MNKSIIFIIFGLMLSLSSTIVYAADCGGSIPCNCSDTLNESRTLTASDTLTDCSDTGLTINGTGITLDCTGYVINGTGGSSTIGVKINYGSNNTSVKNCTIHSFGTGIYGNASLGMNLTNNTIYNLSNPNGAGILITDPSQSIGVSANITNNNITSETGSGVFCSVGTANVINNSIIGYDYGIESGFSGSWGEIKGNNITATYNISGDVVFINSGSPNITENNITGGYDGLYLYTSGSPKVWHNNIYNQSNYKVYSSYAINLSYNNEGNYWGHDSCPLFTAGIDSNAANVIDRYPYNESNGWFTLSPIDCPPVWSNNSTNTTLAGQPCNFSLTWIDDIGLSQYLFSTNNTGTWTNASWVNFSGTTNTSWNITTLNSTKTTLVAWCFYVNDTSGNVNGTSCEAGNQFILTTTDNPPTYSANSTNTTIAGVATEFRVNWTDDIGLSGYIFSFDNCTGSLANVTNWTSMNGLTNWSNFTNVTNSTAGCTIRWKVYANDTYGNWNSTDIMNFTVGLTNDCSCTADNQCVSGHCVHSICRSTDPYCGDGHCDTGETCSADCGSGAGTGTGGLTGTSTTKPVVTLAVGKVNITMGSLTPGGKMIANIARREDVAIRQLNITVVNNVANIKVTIVKIPSLPSTVSYGIEGKVYHYINIEKINITDADINKIFIKFAVNNTWLTDNNVDSSNITMYRWANNRWNDLNALILNESDTEVFYTAESPGLSVFVIGTTGGAPEVPTETALNCTETWSCTDWSDCIDNVKTRTCTDLNTCGTTVNKPAESQSCEAAIAEFIGFPLFSTVAIIMVIIAVVVLVFIKREKVKPFLSNFRRRFRKKKEKKTEYVYKKPK